jgi:DeoR/GlpR family transcriptional regulator of sugar metabolism
VSEATIRRDLLRLEHLGQVVKTYGGAVSNDRTGFESSFQEKASRMAAEKDAIGRLAASLVSEGETVMIDSGTTALRVAVHLHQFNNLTVVTNSLCVAEELGRSPQIHVYILGGQYRARTLDVAGPTAISSIEAFNVDQVFLAVDGIDLTAGLTAADVFAAEMVRAMMRSSRRAHVVADSSKIGRRGFAQIAPITEVDAIITDSGLAPEPLEMFRRSGIEVLVAAVPATGH